MSESWQAGEGVESQDALGGERDFAISLVMSNGCHLVQANRILVAISNSLLVPKPRSALVLQATNIDSRSPLASNPNISQLCSKNPLEKGKST